MIAIRSNIRPSEPHPAPDKTSDRLLHQPTTPDALFERCRIFLNLLPRSDCISGHSNISKYDIVVVGGNWQLGLTNCKQ
jgi:hypothetical protein